MSTISSTQSQDKLTSLSVKADTKERLRKLGEKDQSYDEVIRNLLDISARGYEEERERKKSGKR
jgi:hypothetical protein